MPSGTSIDFRVFEKTGAATAEPKVKQKTMLNKLDDEVSQLMDHHMEPSATSTTVIRPVVERLQVHTEDAPVLDNQRCLHDFGAAYKYPDLLTYLSTAMLECVKSPLIVATVALYTSYSRL